MNGFTSRKLTELNVAVSSENDDPNLTTEQKMALRIKEKFDEKEAMVWLWFGYGLAMVWLWLGYGLAMVWLCFGYGWAMVWLWFGYGLAMVWLWFGYVWSVVTSCDWRDWRLALVFICEFEYLRIR